MGVGVSYFNSEKWASLGDSEVWEFMKAHRLDKDFTWTLGADLGFVSDFCAIALLGVKHPDEYYLRVYHLCSEKQRAKLERVEKISIIQELVDRQDLIVSGGEQLDKNAIVNLIHSVKRKFPLARVSYDKWGWASISSQVSGHIIHPDCLSSAPKHPSISIGYFLDNISSGCIKHTDSPIMNNAMRSVRMTYQGDRIISLDKDKRTHKIDGVMASVYAFNALLEYKDKGGLSLKQKALYLQYETAKR